MRVAFIGFGEVAAAFSAALAARGADVQAYDVRVRPAADRTSFLPGFAETFRQTPAALDEVVRHFNERLRA